MRALFTLVCPDGRRPEITAAFGRNGLELATFSDDLATIHIVEDSKGVLIRNGEETLIRTSVSLPPDDIVCLARIALEVTTNPDAVRSVEDTTGAIAAALAQEARAVLVPLLFTADALARRGAATGDLTNLLTAGLNRVMSILLRITPVQRGGAAPPTCANTIISELADTIRAIAGQAKVVTRLETPIPPAAIERTDLERVLLNIVANATDARRIVLATSSRTATSAKAAGAPAGDWIVVEISNDGTPMTDEICGQVLIPTFTPNAGRGLPSIGQVTHTAGWHISIDNTKKRGTKVEIWLPRAGAD